MKKLRSTEDQRDAFELWARLLSDEPQHGSIRYTEELLWGQLGGGNQGRIRTRKLSAREVKRIWDRAAVVYADLMVRLQGCPSRDA